MTCLSVENLSKSFGIKPLLEHITFGLSKGDKTALVAANGTGKSTLLRIIAGMEKPDRGEVILRSGTRVAMLEQEPSLAEGLSIREYITQADSQAASLVQRYENAASQVQRHEEEASQSQRYEETAARVQGNEEAASQSQRNEKATARVQGNKEAASLIQRNREAASPVQQNERTALQQSKSDLKKARQAFEKALAEVEAAGAWDYEKRMESILGRLGITELDQPVETLSGGERKRVALAFALLENPDLLLLDEPTNHLDVEMIEWLEAWLSRSTLTLLMVTHDRYFLDRVCDHIIEIDTGRLYHHRGNYSHYLEKKAERLEIEETQRGKAFQLYRRELEWIRRSPKARTSKSKSRIDAFYQTEKRAKQKREDGVLRLETATRRMGGKILEMENVTKRFGETIILGGFSHEFQRGERVGILGRNGVGKSTFLNILTGEEAIDSGRIDRGATMVFGHYRQQGPELDENRRMIDIIRDIAEYITLSDGTRISASQFLERFLFPASMQYTPAGKLSGGERRRFGLMMNLIQNPNFLILDEPTNDLDLVTLNRLEDFLLDFKGCLVIVSHDRFFMDKLVQHYFVFEGDGVVRDFNGSYREYREQIEAEEAERRSGGAGHSGGTGRSGETGHSGGARRTGETGRSGGFDRSGGAGRTDGPGRSGGARHSGETGRSGESTEGDRSPDSPSSRKTEKAKPKGLTYRERKEIQKLEKEIAKLEREKAEIEEAMNQTGLSPESITDLSNRYAGITDLLEETEIRWLELADRS